MTDLEVLSLREALHSGWADARAGQWDTGFAAARRLFVAAKDAGDDWALAECMLQLAWFGLQMGHSSDGIDSADGAKRLYLQCGDRAKHAFASAVHAWLMLDVGLIDEGFSEGQTAVALAEAAGDASALAFALHAKAISLVYSRQHDLAQPVLERGLAIAEAAGDLATASLINNTLGYSRGSLGDVFAEKGEGDPRALHAQSAAYFLQATQQAELAGDIGNYVVAIINGAETAVLLEDVPLALAMLDQVEPLLPPLGPRCQAHYIYTRAQAMLHLGRVDEALALSERALELADSAGHLDNKVNALRRLSEVHESMGNFDRALTHYKLYHTAHHDQMGVLTQRRAQITEMRLENARLRSVAEQFERLATSDPLTNLPNRRSLDARLLELEGRSFAVAILDLDHFKLVNDRFSHGVGDDVLRRTAALLASYGDEPMAFRLGGEEFALVFASDDLMQARQTCEQMRQQLQGLDWSDLGKGLHVTCSIGVAVGMSGEHILPEADRRLYRAKAAGRNRVIAHDLDEVVVSSQRG